jgi:transcription initiation factor TFIIB
MVGGGMSTKIDGRGKDYAGRQLGPDAARSAKRINTINKRSRIEGTIERNLSHAGSYMDRLYKMLNLPQQVGEDGMRIYKKALEKDLIRGRSIDDMAAASLYNALRANERADIKRRPVDIAKAGNVGKKEMMRCYRLLLRELGVKGKVESPSSRVPQLVSTLSFDPMVERAALGICHYIENGNEMRAKNVSGKDPVGLAAAAIYMAQDMLVEIGLTCGRATQETIADKAKVTEVTLRNRYGQIANALGTNKDEWKLIAEFSGKLATEGRAMDLQEISKLMRNFDEAAALKYLGILRDIGVVVKPGAGDASGSAPNPTLYSLRKELYEI